MDNPFSSQSGHPSSGPDWDKRYREGDTPWERGEAAPELVAHLASTTYHGRVLVPGCGTGHEVRLAASHGLNALGLDLSPSAINKARSFPKSPNTDYTAGDFLKLDTSLQHVFDLIIEHTCFCTLPDKQRAQYVESAALALKPGGKLLGIFFLEIEDPEPDQPPFPCPTHELEALFSKRFILKKSQRVTHCFPGRERDHEQLYLWQVKS